MPGEILVRCVPDPMQGPGTLPCPQGYIATTLETHIPAVIAVDDWSGVAVEASVALVLAYTTGLVLGSIAKHMKDATR